LSQILCVDHHVPRHLAFDSNTPALLIGGLVCGPCAERTVRVVTYVIQQTQRASRRLNQSVRKGITQMEVGCGSIILISSDHVGVLVEALAAVGHDSAGAGTRLAVIDA